MIAYTVPGMANVSKLDCLYLKIVEDLMWFATVAKRGYSNLSQQRELVGDETI